MSVNVEQHEEELDSPFLNRDVVYNHSNNSVENEENCGVQIDGQEETTVGQTFEHSGSLEKGST